MKSKKIAIACHSVKLLCGIVLSLSFSFVSCQHPNAQTARPAQQDACGASRSKNAPNDQYTEDKAMLYHHSDPERALTMIDSAVIVGNITEERGQYLKALTQYGGMNNYPLARQMCLDLIDNSPDSVTLQDTYSLLTSIEYSSGKFPAVIPYATEASRLAHALDMPGEVGMMEGYIAQAMAETGRTDEGIDRLRSVIDELRKVDSSGGVKAFQTTSKKLLHILIGLQRFTEAVPVCEAMLERLDEFENNPERFCDVKNGKAPSVDFLDFSRGQTLAFLTVVYARLATKHADDPALHAQYLEKGLDAEAKVFQTNWSQSPDCDKLLSSAYHHLGQFDRFDQAMDRLNASMKDTGDTINHNFFIRLLKSSEAAEMRGRYREALGYHQRAFNIHDSLDYYNQRDQLNELATTYHLQEEQIARYQAEAEAERSRIIIIALAAGLFAAIAFLAWFFRQKRIIEKKNRVLAREIAEAIKYKEMAEGCGVGAGPVPAREASKLCSSDSAPEASKPCSSDSELFYLLRDTILRERLYLDPRLDRQTLCDRFGLSNVRIGAAFAKGSPYKSLIDFLNDCRLPYAAKLLNERPDLSIADVARESGFPSADTFGRNFKQKYALTPSQYRDS